VSSDRGTAAVIFMMAARRAVRSGALWGAVFGAYVFSAVAQYAAIGKTAADRTRLAATTGTNIGLEALLGDARRIDTVAGYIEWRSVGVLCMLGAVWALLVATRLTRGEEDAGRWELLLAGGTTRGRALSLVMAGLAAGLVALWAVAAAACVAVGHSSHAGFTVTASLFLATTLAGAVAMFLAVGLVCGQLAGTRREANQLAGAVLGITFVIRMIDAPMVVKAFLGREFGWI
jgi:ABC-2 type transport system permease protein